MQARLDYIFFVYGLSFIVLACTCFCLARKLDRLSVWPWLGWFGLLHGLNEWLDMLALSLGDSPVFKAARLGLLAVSFLPLLEFGRRGLRAHAKPAPRPWLYLPFLALAACGALAGMDGLNAACRYTLGLPGGLLAAWVLWHESQQTDLSRRWPLRLAGAALFVYALATGLIVPRADLLPASFLNQQTFQVTLGFPVQLLRAGGAALIALGFWMTYCLAQNQDSSSALRRWLTPAVVLLLLVSGWFAADWRANLADEQMRQRLSSQAQSIAWTINPEDVKRLSFSESDNTNPHFLELRSQMRAYARAVGHRSIYSMALRGQEIVFGPECLDEIDPDASPPGTVYQQPTLELQGSFRTASLFTEGPCTDEYGTFVSAFAPVRDPRTGQVLLMIGLDVEADQWQADIARQRLTAILFTLGLALVILAVKTILHWRNQLPDERQERYRHLEAALTILCGLVLTTVLIYVKQDGDLRARHLMFSKLANNQMSNVVDLFSDIRDHQSASLVRFFESSRDVTRAEFRRFTAIMVQQPHVGGVGWAPRIPAADKNKFEKQIRDDGMTDFGVFHFDAQGQKRPVPPADVYYPICYVEPYAEIKSVLGFDVQTEPARWAAAQTALQRQMPTATDPIHRLSNQELAVNVYMPVFPGETILADDEILGSADPSGLVYITLRLNKILEKSFHPASPTLETAVADFYQLEENAPPRFLVSSLPRADASPLERTPLLQGHAFDFGAVHPLFMFGKAYALVIRPGPVFLAAYASHAWGLTALVGLLLTALTALFIDFLSNRRVDLEKIVRVRTEELRASEESYRRQFADNSAVMFMLDPADGRFLDANAAALAFYGYTREQMLALHISQINTLPPAQLRHIIGSIVAGQKKQFEFQHRLADGSLRDVEASVSLIRFGHRQVLHSIITDITPRKQAEVAVRQLSRAVEQTPTSVVITDLEGKITFVNQAFCRVTGYTEQEALGQNPRVLKSGLMPAAVYKELWDTIKAGREWRGELQNRRKNGQLYWELAVISPLTDGRGNITHYLAVKDDITVRKQMEDELRSAARTDKLTGLPNRAMLGDRLQQAVLRARRMQDYRFAVLFLDFDRFKNINDSLGHESGDQLLQEIAIRLRAVIREGDSLSSQAGEHTTARLGGDEFVVLLDGIQESADAQIVADRLLEAFALPYRLGGREVYATASIGIVTSANAADTAEGILRDADTAMYEAKLAGKGRYVTFDVSMRDRVQNRLHLENDLRKALESDQLFLVYQPIVSLRTGEVESLETLVRWRHPQRGLISPGEFIPIAEDTGLIIPIGEWVLRESCRQFSLWRQDLGPAAPRGISVNLSRNQLLLPNLPDTIRRILAETSVPPQCLHLEITESAVMRDVDLATRILRAVKEVGVKLDMDDFGTGYSSLACLHQFPIDVLKIDRSFVANIDRGKDFAALVHAVTQLAGNMGIPVVAEGIETADQVLILQSLECDFGQGYFFSSPLAAAQIPNLKISPGLLQGLAPKPAAAANPPT
ncbi:MAG: EAL domain-containing protein [Phycisphaeraceae bacterium]|nr:EAL domain-containing protein [Phycisphaeraceae bacterium]